MTQADQAKINTAIPLTEEETEERDTLLEQGFSNWSKKDFLHFCKACERFGRDDIDSIKNEVESKTPEEVVAYWEVSNDNTALTCCILPFLLNYPCVDEIFFLALPVAATAVKHPDKC
jgi:hypothetical protein